MNVEESRTHFSAWCVTSAPLTLGFDLTNETRMAETYPIISNKEAIAINQAVRGCNASPSWMRACRCKGSSRLVVLVCSGRATPAGWSRTAPPRSTPLLSTVLVATAEATLHCPRLRYERMFPSNFR